MTDTTLQQQIDQGEGQYLEFKSSFQWDYDQQRVNKDLHEVIAKSVAAFMNREGGTLLIGVADDGRLLGLNKDLGSLTSPDLDALERKLRQRLSFFLGKIPSLKITVEFPIQDETTLMSISCPMSDEPVFFGKDPPKLFVRNGNLSEPLSIKEAFEYSKSRWPSPVDTDHHHEPQEADHVGQLKVTDFAQLLKDLIRTGQSPMHAPASSPSWLTVGTTRVLNLLLDPISTSRILHSTYIIRPWISQFDKDASLSFDGLVDRLIKDQAIAYVVTRPPEHEWHREAIDQLAESGRASIAFVPSLHAKLYYAETNNGPFAMIGSANFTRQSMTNRELGLLVTSLEGGKEVIRNLRREAFDIYRTPGRDLLCKANLSSPLSSPKRGKVFT